MKRKLTHLQIALCCCAVMLTLAACGGSPGDDVANYRGMYTARLNGFLVQEAEAGPEMMDEMGAAAEAEAGATAAGAEAAEAEETAEGEMVEGEMEEEAPPRANPNIMLDILIQHDSPTMLPGVTVDVSMVDPDEKQKASWKVYFDTSTVNKANATQYTHVLEDVPYEEGDGFFAEIRHPVPAAERGEYREFSPAG